jgi:ornithine cyclodeaminase
MVYVGPSVRENRTVPHEPIAFTYLNGPDIAALALADDEILAAVEEGLRRQGQGATVIEPRTHLRPRGVNGHFNVLRGVLPAAGGPGFAGVKVVGDFVDNWRRGLPSEMAVLLLFDPETGMPKALLDATAITEMRTGALTAIGAKHLARPDAKVLGHVGARGTAYWNVRLLDRLFGFEEIRVHSKRPESREAFAARLSADLKKPVRATADWRSCLEGADVMVEASRLEQPEPLFRTEWVKPGALVVPYGTMSAVELDLTDVMDKVVVDDWGQAGAGPFGALRRHVDEGKLTRETLHAELGEIVAGRKPGRERADETILFWHRGLSLSDIALGALALEKAARLGLGQTLRYA